MNRVITISREFGSGGRELGKRLAEMLQVAYYDKEIVSAISEKSSLAESYVSQIIEQRIVTYYPITIATSFASMPYDAMGQINRSIYTAQADILKEMAEKSDCIIVGRCADFILREYKPLNIFVYADMASKIERCRQREDEMSHLSDKELQKRIQSIDKARARYYSSYTGQVWGDKLNYHLCVNTSDHDVKAHAKAIAAMLSDK